MTEALDEVAPAFVEMAHRIVWATAATIDTAGNPSTRILHPVWEWNSDALTGWIATSPLSTKANHQDSERGRRVDPISLRVMDGSRMLGGGGRLLRWKAAS